MENVFNNLNVDPIEGTRIMQAAGITPTDLADTFTFSKVLDIMEFFKGRPDTEFMINKLLTGKPGINAVDHLFSYAKLRTDYENNLKKVEQLKEQLYHYE